MIADQFSQLEYDGGVVFLPSLRAVPGTDRVCPELRRLTDGRLALPAYTSIGELVAGCGEHQPWVAVSTEQFQALTEQLRIDTVALNLPIPQAHRHGADHIEDTFPGMPERWND